MAGQPTKDTAASGTPAADIARLGKPAPGASPDGAAGYWSGPGMDAWLTQESGEPVGYVRNTDHPGVAVRIDDGEAWAAIVDKLGLTKHPEGPPAGGPPPAPGQPAPGADGQQPADGQPPAGQQPPADGQQPAAGEQEPDTQDPAEPTERDDATDGPVEQQTDPAAGDPAKKKKKLKPQGKAAVGAARAAGKGPADKEPDDQPETGIMIALMVPDGEGSDLAIDHPRATPARDLHITLAYLGKTADVTDEGEFVAKMLEAVREVAAQYNDVTGKINGVGRWWTPEGDCLYYSFDSPVLPEMRHDLFEALDDVGLAPDTDHGFSPHITLTYLGEGEEQPIKRVQPKELGFPAISVMYGGTRIDVALDRTHPDDDEGVMLVRGDIPDSTAPSVQLKAGGPPIAAGVYVSWPAGKGRVDMVVTNGKVPGVEEDVEGTKDAPAARVVVYAQSGGSWRATGKKVGRKVNALKRILPLKGGTKSLNDLLVDHAADATERGVEPVETKSVQEVWSRGRQAWPGPDVGVSQDDWAAGRVSAFLAKALGEPVHTAYVRDDDLLPARVAGGDVEEVDISDTLQLLADLRGGNL